VEQCGAHYLRANKKETEVKTCTKCHTDKELDQFSKGRNQCKDCMKAYKKEYRTANPLKDVEYRKANSGAIAERMSGYYEQNKGSLTSKQREYYGHNAGAVKAKVRNWRKLNPVRTRIATLKNTTLKGMPLILVETQAINNLIKYTLKTQRIT